MSKHVKLVYEFGPFRLDTAERQLLRDGQPVQLTPKAFDTLVLLIQNGGRLLDKEDLMKKIWPDTFVEEANLANNISLLRRVLGESSTEHQFIETLPRRGYRFMASVTQVRDEAAELIASETSVNLGHTGVGSIAVLPFKPLAPDGSDEYLGLGMADALITKLSNIVDIIVRPTSAVRKYAGLEQDPVVAGRELRVESVLEGSVRRSHDRFRVTVQLVSVRDGVSLWAEKFDENCADIFAVEDSISEQVAKALMLRLSGEQKRLLKKRYTESTEAYQLYLKGRYYWNKWSHGGFTKAIEYFQQAIEKDPRYALAYSGLADAYGLLGIQGFLSTKETMPKAEAATLKALEIDERLAEAHVPLACVRCWCDWDFAGAESEFKSSIELNPNYVTAHLPYALYLTAMGRFDEACAEIKKAQELDPFSLVLNATESYILYNARQYNRAIEQAINTLEMDANFYPAYERLGEAYEQIEMYEQAIAAFQQAITLSEGSLFSVAQLGHAYALSGRSEEARKVVEDLQVRLNREYLIAWVYAGLGEKDQAFKWLEKAYEERDSSMVYLKVDPKLDSLRSDPRFADLLRRVGLS